MSDERSNSELISEYLSILSKSGSHSPQAREFLAEHQDRPAFQSISDRSKREESYIDQQAKRAGKRRRRALYWVLGSSIALVIIGVTLLIGWIASLVSVRK